MQRAQRIGERADLLTAFNVAPEQDVARRIGIREKRALVSGEF